MKLIDDIVNASGGMRALRRDIHAHPELCFEEHRTSDLIAQQLQQWGISVLRGMGRTGVVGVVHGRDQGQCGRAIGLRADMDALPMTEFNRFEHASQHVGKMHACGHDGHVAMLLAAAQHLAQHRDFDGTVYLIFQPAEEGGGGAREMIRDGLFEQCPMQAVYAIHNWPNLQTGQVAISPGPVMASSNEFLIRVNGKGAHAAMPHLGLDPVPVACQLVQAFQTIVSRNKKPIDAGVISVTMIHAGEATNVIPDSVELQGTVRTFSLEVLDMIEERMREMSEQLCAAFDMTCEFSFARNYPPTINHEAQAQQVHAAAARLLGVEHVLKQEPTMGAEDFSYMLLEKPGAYLFLGNGDGSHRAVGHGGGPCTLHNPSFDFNDDLIPIGASLWVEIVRQELGAHASK